MSGDRSIGKRRLGWFRAGWVAYWVMLSTLTHIPKVPGLGPSIRHADKLVHVGLFFGLTWLGGVSLGLRVRSDALSITLKWAVVYVVYGACDEWSQRFVGRHVSVHDWLANAAGVVLASLLLIYQSGRLNPSRSRWNRSN